MSLAPDQYQHSYGNTVRRSYSGIHGPPPQGPQNEAGRNASFYKPQPTAGLYIPESFNLQGAQQHQYLPPPANQEYRVPGGYHQSPFQGYFHSESDYGETGARSFRPYRIPYAPQEHY